jgi:protoporphyrinogen oxidase
VGYTQKVVAIGAGISGLACAYRLKQLGIPCLVLEARERPGGVIATIRRNGFLFETGPQCPRFPQSVWQLVRDLNLEAEFVAGDPGAKRYKWSATGIVGSSITAVRINKSVPPLRRRPEIFPDISFTESNGTKLPFGHFIRKGSSPSFLCLRDSAGGNGTATFPGSPDS